MVASVVVLSDLGELDSGSSAGASAGLLAAGLKASVSVVARVTVLMTSVLASRTGLTGSLALGGDNT